MPGPVKQHTTMKQTDKAAQLRTHKLLATGLFFLMLVVYILSTWWSRKDPAVWLGYVQAFSEAAMVGALADWFAVTALFHHPLGIPIPHTNLIEKSKQSIGDNLGDFVVGNFLTPGNIRPYIEKLSVSSYVAQWLEKEKNRHLLISEVSFLLKDIILKMDDETVVKFIANKGGDLVNSVRLHLVVANALEYVLDKKEHDKLITLLAGKIKDYIGQNDQLVQEKVKEESYFFVPGFVENKLAAKISNGLKKYFEDIELDENHQIREEIVQQLYKFTEDLRTQPKWEEELARLKAGLLSDESIQRYAGDVWQSLRRTLLEELSNNESAMMAYFNKSVNELAQSMKDDPVLQKRIDSWIHFNAYRYIMRNRGQVSTLISNTVGNWEGRELSQKLELEVGKDLQFIRINGTVVGGIVGCFIHFMTRLLGG